MSVESKVKKYSGIGHDISKRITDLNDEQLKKLIRFVGISIDSSFSRKEKIGILHKQRQNKLRKALSLIGDEIYEC